MNIKKTHDENLLDAQLDFIMNAPMEQFEEYFSETGIDRTEFNLKATSAFDRAFENQAKAQQAVEALASLTPAQQATVAKNLNIRRSVLSALREHRAVVSSIPQRFMRLLAAEIGQTLEAMNIALAGPSLTRLISQHKADGKPIAIPPRVSFEQLLRDAAMTEVEVQELMREDDSWTP